MRKAVRTVVREAVQIISSSVDVLRGRLWICPTLVPPRTKVSSLIIVHVILTHTVADQTSHLLRNSARIYNKSTPMVTETPTSNRDDKYTTSLTLLHPELSDDSVTHDPRGLVIEEAPEAGWGLPVVPRGRSELWQQRVSGPVPEVTHIPYLRNVVRVSQSVTVERCDSREV